MCTQVYVQYSMCTVLYCSVVISTAEGVCGARLLHCVNYLFNRFSNLFPQMFHSHVLQLFVSGDHSVLEYCLKWLVPCVQMMAQDNSLLCSQETVAIRKEWCNRLEQDILPESEW